MKTKINIGFTFLFFLFSIILSAQGTYFWKVTSKNGNHTSYLFGTMHRMGESFYNKYSALDKALKSADVVVTEVELIRDEVAANYTDRKMTNDLGKILSKEDLKRISEILELPENDIKKLYPNEIVKNLQWKFITKSCSFLNTSDQFFLDEYIQKIAKETHKKMIYLETLKEQLAYLDRVSKDSITWKSAKMPIKTILRQYEKSKNTCPKLVEEYASFKYNINLNKSCDNYNENGRILQTNRNENWMKTLPELIERNAVFVAVGIRHFERQCGLIQQLKSLGYSVDPVPMQ